MGMYTGIRFKGYVKKKFRKNFEDIALRGDWEYSDDPYFQEFSELGRASFIPCGQLAYMPDEWETFDDSYEKYSREWFASSKASDGFDRTWNKKTGYWTFQCSLKNYANEIEQWFSILPHFIKKIDHLEYFYEEWDWSKQYDIVNNEVVCINEKFKNYVREVEEENE